MGPGERGFLNVVAVSPNGRQSLLTPVWVSAGGVRPQAQQPQPRPAASGTVSAGH